MLMLKGSGEGHMQDREHKECLRPIRRYSVVDIESEPIREQGQTQGFMNELKVLLPLER